MVVVVGVALVVLSSLVMMVVVGVEVVVVSSCGGGRLHCHLAQWRRLWWWFVLHW